MTPFANRTAAGKALAEAVAAKSLLDPVVLALPRGGVPVAAEVARVLNAPLDLVMVRKIGVPWQPELAAAAVIDGKNAEIVVNDEVCAEGDISRNRIDEMAKVELKEIERRAKLYLKGRSRVPISGRSAIVVDDGIATGTTIRAVIKALRRKQPKAILLAVPVAPKEAIAALRAEADDIICLDTPEPFWGISAHYADFHQVSDEEVIRILEAQEPKEAKPKEQAKPNEGKAKKRKKSKKVNTAKDAKTAAAAADQPA
jgi:putative phosphoribosyl transferase